MKGVQYEIKLRGLKTPEGTLPLLALVGISQILVECSQRALRLLVEGISVKRGKTSASLKKCLDFTIIGISKGSTVLQVEAPTFAESAPEIVQQLNLWSVPLKPALKPKDTAISILSKSIHDATGGNVESEYYDRGVLESFISFRSLLKEHVENIQIECQSRPTEKFIINEHELDRISRIEAETPEPKATVVAGIFNSIKHTPRQFELVLQDGHKVRGLAESGYIDTESMRDLWGNKVTVKGLAHFRPNGLVRSIEADVIKPFENGEELFEHVSRSRMTKSVIHRLRTGQENRNPLKEIWGKWPGDESIEEILDTLNRNSKEAI